MQRSRSGGSDLTGELAEVQRLATAWTGNDTRVLEFGEGEVSGSEAKSVLEDALQEASSCLGRGVRCSD